MKLNKYLQKGGITPRKVIVEKGEYIKDSEGEVFKIGPDMPSHDDTLLLIDGKEKKVKKGKGGVAITDVVQVVSATTENRRKKDKTHKDTDEAIKFFEEEGESFIFNTFGLKANLKRSVSPAGIIDATMDRIDTVTKKYGSLEFREDSPYAQRSAAANAAYLDSLPSLEEVFDIVFEEQERKKEEAIITDEDEYAQIGGSVGKKFLKAQTGRTVPSPQDLGVLNPSDRASLQVRNSLKDSSSVRAAKEAAAIRLADERRRSAKLTPYNPQSVGSKAIDVALNPMATAGYLVREGRVPDHMVHGQQNLFDSALQLGLSGGAAAVASGLSVTKDLTSGEAGLGTAVEAASGLVGARDAVSKYRKFSEAQRRLKEVERIKPRLAAPQEGIDWMRKWYNDPITKEKADKFFTNNYPKHFTKDDLENKIQLLSEDEMQSLSLDRIKDNDNGVLGTYYTNAVDRYPVSEKDYPMSGRIYVADTKTNTPEEITSTTIHELTHLMTDGERFLSDDNANALGKNLKTFGVFPFYLGRKDTYLSEPTEIYARFNELRKAEGLTPNSEISPELMDKIMTKGVLGHYKIDPRFFQLIKDPEYTREFLNKVLPASAGAVGTAGVVSQNQKQQTGGNTKGVLQSPNRNLITTVRLKSGKVVPIESIDGVVPDRAAPYLAPDSVNVTKDWLGRYHAERYYDSKLKKYLK